MKLMKKWKKDVDFVKIVANALTSFNLFYEL